jgi:ABC-type proline/glycine betaine transport system permease subunit
MANKKALTAGAAGLGAMVGAGIGEKTNPLQYVGTPDMSSHINNLDGTASHTMQAMEVLNQTGNHTAMAIGAGLGAIAGGVALHHALGRQFRKN